MSIRVLKPSQIKKLEINKNDIFIVIDTFRATTSLLTLKNAGVRKIYVVQNEEQAKELHSTKFPKSLLVGEKGGFKIKDFDYGNTPSVFYDSNFKNKEIIFTSTSGAKTFLLLHSRKNVYAGALVNLSSLSIEISRNIRNKKCNIYIIPSGYFMDENEYVVEDWLTAVLIAEKLAEKMKFSILNKDDFWEKTKKMSNNHLDFKKLLLESP
ncbi:MAG: 2-phosphosulfolactate phosphatase, partial [Candidatus Thorarchaeota archaeon]